MGFIQWLERKRNKHGYDFQTQPSPEEGRRLLLCFWWQHAVLNDLTKWGFLQHENEGQIQMLYGAYEQECEFPTLDVILGCKTQARLALSSELADCMAAFHVRQPASEAEFPPGRNAPRATYHIRNAARGVDFCMLSGTSMRPPYRLEEPFGTTY